MSKNEKIAILIPAYNPDEELLALVRNLRTKFTHVLVIDDGSASGDVFGHVESLGGMVLHHVANRGKGAALRTGMAWIVEHWMHVMGIVTADADGQHSVADIGRIADALENQEPRLVLGTRSFRKDVPFRSRIGNLLTCLLFHLLTGIRLADTQTGLRGIPRGMLERMLEIPGDGYEYEMRMLADCRHHPLPPREVKIATIYRAGNSSSHFSPLKDSVKVWRALLGSVFGGRAGK